MPVSKHRKPAKKIRFYDELDDEVIYIDIDEAKRTFHEFVGCSYNDIDDFMECHRISPKHKAYIEGKQEEGKE